MIACSHCFKAIDQHETHYIFDGGLFCIMCWITSGSERKASRKYASHWDGEVEEMFKRTSYIPIEKR